MKWYASFVRVFVFGVAVNLSLFSSLPVYGQSPAVPQRMILKGTFGSGEGDVTSTVYVGKDAYDIYFPDGMEAKQQKAIEKLVSLCSAANKRTCEIDCLVEFASKDDEYYGYIRDIVSINPLNDN